MYGTSDAFLTHLQTPVTIPFDPTLRPKTDFLPLDAGITADNSTGNQPTQIHLTIAGPNAISVNWATGRYKVCQANLLFSSLYIFTCVLCCYAKKLANTAPYPHVALY